MGDAHSRAGIPETRPFRMTVCGIAELGGHCDAGVSHVLSILDPLYPHPDAFGAFGEHERLELRFHDIIEEIPGLLAPSEADIGDVLAFGRALSRARGPGPHLLVHCHMGVSRSTAAMLLILAQAQSGRAGADLLAEVVRIRPQAWPNLRMVEFGDRLLRRGGDLVEATLAHYRTAMAERPGLAAAMTAHGRGREVAAARDRR